MSLLGAIGKSLNQAWGVAVQVGKQIVKASAPVVRAAVAKTREIVDAAAKHIERSLRKEATSGRQFVDRELQDVNERISELRRIYQGRGNLSRSQREEFEVLKRRREHLRKELEALDAIDLAQDIAEQPSEFEARVVTDQDAHLIDMVSGQNSYGKRCSRADCGRAMVLQWDRSVSAPRLKDFVWGCSGWYIVLANGRRACTYMEPLSKDDFHIFANVKKPEFQVSLDELTRRVTDPAKAKRLREALDSVRQQNRSNNNGISQYRCPVHGEPMRLQRKNQTSDGLLDEYFLGCPRWLPKQKGCNFLIKLKSPGRLSAVVRASTGTDVFSVLES